ncbi:kinase-like domain-containing protein [Cadophora sp. MPI-SDFR-AT-0126]|nr:kinase-like domain-containing protein [Leotiomycetes sp. MPI-SDFR-AT-0126]
MDPRIPVKSTKVPVQPRYIPQDPSELQHIASTIKVVRTSDQSKFLATKVPKVFVKDTNGNPTETLLADVILPVAAVPISLILNHPNIISLVDIVTNSNLEGTSTAAGPYGDITVWEDMDAGSLSYLLPSASTYPPFHDEATWHVLASQNYNRPALPEGLCWHVLRSISRALLWLHYGVKETIGKPGDFQKHDDDWHAILIMDVSPGQVWFKRPVGEETYGECKLGGFQWAKVTGAVGGKVANAQMVENAPLQKQYFFPPEVYKNTHSHSRSSEIWQLGATIYTMMTGIPPPRLYEYSWQISRMNDGGYSQELRHIVGDMIQMHPDDRPNAIDLVNRVDDQWRKWRATSKQGAQVVDILDRQFEMQSLGVSYGGLVF